MEIARRYMIEGTVQGVGYRFFAIRTAERLGVRGYVRNTPTGAVEVVAEGEQETVFEFKRHLGAGPSGARVHRIIEEKLDPSGKFTGFDVRY